jgi:hypothetical protein
MAAAYPCGRVDRRNGLRWLPAHLSSCREGLGRSRSVCHFHHLYSQLVQPALKLVPRRSKIDILNAQQGPPVSDLEGGGLSSLGVEQDALVQPERAAL